MNILLYAGVYATCESKKSSSLNVAIRRTKSSVNMW
jgi:hypothetical protein